MQGVYTYIPETNDVPREYNVATIMLLLFMVLIWLVSVLNLLYFYIIIIIIIIKCTRQTQLYV
jgi:energy-coupling factor transporter transmembrane protein EcfT